MININNLVRKAAKTAAIVGISAVLVCGSGCASYFGGKGYDERCQRDWEQMKRASTPRELERYLDYRQQREQKGFEPRERW